MDLITVPNGMGMAETPDGYFRRVLNPNPGLMALQFPALFFDQALDLPDRPGEGNMTMQQYQDFYEMRGA